MWPDFNGRRATCLVRTLGTLNVRIAATEQQLRDPPEANLSRPIPPLADVPGLVPLLTGMCNSQELGRPPETHKRVRAGRPNFEAAAAGFPTASILLSFGLSH